MRIKQTMNCSVFLKGGVLALLQSRLQARTFLLTLCVCFSVGVSADDTDLFFDTTSPPPNILFVLDTSGSMGWRIGDNANDPTRMQEMKLALTGLINNLDGINAGIMTYNSTSRINLVEPVRAIDDNRGDLLNEVDNLTPGGATATLRALWFAHQYFRGGLRRNSPITHECQENHVVLLTDGSPSTDRAAVNTVAPVVGGCEEVTVAGTRRGGNGTCGAELGQYMFDTDHSARVPGVNNVITHTIGFNFSEPWLATVSGNSPPANNPAGEPEGGFGRHFTVSNSAGLQAAFNSILEGISTTFATPTIALNSYNESRHRDELFYAQFQPRESTRWHGNIKKYKLLGGEIVDADQDPLVDENGHIDENSRSLWSDVNDGASVAEGGFAYELPGFEDRHWYTDYNSTVPIKVTADDVTSGNAPLPVQSLDAADANERDSLLLWALGSDIDGDDSTQNHYYVADSLHNTPSLLSYEAKLNQDRREILYSGNNLGVLHAIDAESGEELWSYTPEEHLENIKAYYTDARSRDHVYGLDGEFTLHTTRSKPAGYQYRVEDAWLYMTERRGGNRVYALDVSNGLADPDNQVPFSVMWKITGGTDGPPDKDSDNDGVNDAHTFADLAQTWSKPEMVTVSYDCPNDCKTRDLLMFSGGYNAAVYDDEGLDYATHTAPASGHGNAVYLVDPETGALEWSVGNGDHHSLDLQGMEHSVPSTPVPIDSDLDGKIDILFFIDIAGNVWRVDFDEQADNLDEIHAAGGQIADLSPVGESPRFFNPLDVAISGTSFSTAYFYLVTGSGMRSNPLYQASHNNRLYSIIDRWVHEAPYRIDNNGVKESDYNYVTSSTGSHSIITPDPNVLKDVSDTNSTTSVEYGFFKPFEPGEKVLVPTRIHRNRVFTNTFVPPVANGGVGCGFEVGRTRLYITSLPQGDNVIPEDPGGEYIDVGDGLLSGGQIIDTGEGDAPYFLIDKEVFSVKELIAPDDTEVFRRFRRTGWVELDDY